MPAEAERFARFDRRTPDARQSVAARFAVATPSAAHGMELACGRAEGPPNGAEQRVRTIVINLQGHIDTGASRGARRA